MSSARWAIRTLAAVGATGAFLLLPSAASAVVTSVEGGPSVGIQPRETAYYWAGTVKLNGLNKGEVTSNAAAKTFASSGNPVLHSANTYVIYWDPQDYFDGDWQRQIDEFMTNMGNASGSLASVFAVDTQYTDATNKPASGGSSFHGAYTDTNPYPAAGCTDPHPFVAGAPLVEGKPACFTDAQMRAQLAEFIVQHSLPKGMSAVYYLMTPPGVTVCLDTGGAATGHCSDFAGTFTELEKEEATRQKDEEEKLLFVPSENYESYKRSFCSYHGAIGAGGEGTILYSMIPWTAGGAGSADLAPADQTSDYPCQDGGFEPFTKPTGEIQEAERPKPKTKLEEEEFAKKGAKEKREAEEAEELGLSKRHIQEPNQLGEAFDSDGDHDVALTDLIVNQIAVEQQNVVTDPLMNAWKDSSGNEVTDECRNSFFPKLGGSANATPDTRAGTLSNQSFTKAYYLNDSFNMAALRLSYPGVPCLTGVNLVPSFSAPNAVNANEVVGFDGMESDVDLNSTLSFPAQSTTYTTFTWNFGDGSPEVSGLAPGATSENSPASSPCAAPWLAPCAASTFHSYAYGGTYQVTLTVRDVGGHVASVTRPVTVVGPAQPAPAGGSGGGSAGGGASASSAGGATGGSSSAVVPTPSLSALVLSKNLRTVLRRGLSVHYSVSEQVAGRFEVLLATSLARRLHLSGPSAVGLAAGTPPQTIIGKTILATAHGGSGTLAIRLSSQTIKRLRRMRSVSLVIRLVVHNSHAKYASALAAVTLSH